jgi:hypothetical protein
MAVTSGWAIPRGEEGVRLLEAGRERRADPVVAVDGDIREIAGAQQALGRRVGDDLVADGHLVEHGLWREAGERRLVLVGGRECRLSSPGVGLGGRASHPLTTRVTERSIAASRRKVPEGER